MQSRSKLGRELGKEVLKNGMYCLITPINSIYGVYSRIEEIRRQGKPLMFIMDREDHARAELALHKRANSMAEANFRRTVDDLADGNIKGAGVDLVCGPIIDTLGEKLGRRITRPLVDKISEGEGALNVTGRERKVIGFLADGWRKRWQSNRDEYDLD